MLGSGKILGFDLLGGQSALHALAKKSYRVVTTGRKVMQHHVGTRCPRSDRNVNERNRIIPYRNSDGL